MKTPFLLCFWLVWVPSVLACDREPGSGKFTAEQVQNRKNSMITAALAISDIVDIKDSTLNFGGFGCWHGKLESVRFIPENRHGDNMQPKQSVFKDGEEVQVRINCWPDDAMPGPCMGPLPPLCSKMRQAKRVQLWLYNVNTSYQKCIGANDVEIVK